MKKRIIVEHGEVKRIALLMNCTYEMVSHSLGGVSKLRNIIKDELHLRNGVAFVGLPKGYQAGEGDPENGFDARRCRSG